MKIHLYVRDVYGKLLVYAHNPDQAAAISKITGKKTLSLAIIQGLMDLGHTFSIPKDSIPPDSEASGQLMKLLQSFEQ